MPFRWMAFAIVFVPQCAFAVRFHVTTNDRPVAGAEVCVFRGVSSGTLVDRIFGTGEIKCAPAADDRALPAGDWRAFARKAGEVVSDRVVTLPADAKDVELRVGPTAHATFANVPSGATLFGYVGRTGALLPVLDGDVPAATDFVPIAVTREKLVIAGDRQHFEAGANVKVLLSQPSPNVIDVIVPVEFAPKAAAAPAAPLVGVSTKRGPTSPLLPLPAPREQARLALAIIRNVPAGAMQVDVSGEGWKTVRRPIAATPGGQVVVADPIAAVRAMSAVVTWAFAQDPRQLVSEHSDCAAVKKIFRGDVRSKEPVFTAVLRACPADQTAFDEMHPDRCPALLRHSLTGPANQGEVRFDDLAGGLYAVDFEYPGLPPVYKSFTIDDGANARIDAVLHYISFFGKVTRGGKPEHAALFGTTTDPDTGEYLAVLTKAPRAGVTTEVAPCEGKDPYRFVPREAPVENSAFDIDIPDNAIEISVRDRATQAPLGNASITMAILAGELTAGTAKAHFGGLVARTDDQGTARLTTIATDQQLRICASLDSYDIACEPTFEMRETKSKTISFALVRHSDHAGKLEGGPYVAPQIAWYSPASSSMTEVVRTIGSDGSFTWQQEHGPGEIVVVTAANAPLYAFRQPQLDDPAAPFVISPPAAPARTFDVMLSPSAHDQRAWLALYVGNVAVPTDALLLNQMMRHADATLQPGRTITVHDVLATGPITVVLIPQSVSDRYEAMRHFVYPFIPDAAALPRQLLTGNAVVFH